MDKETTKWHVNEIFNSISGEISPFHQGRFTTFVRLSGCVAACPYCDTDHSFEMDVHDSIILQDIKEQYSYTHHMCITGGEPLLQPELVDYLISNFKNVWIETSGLVSFKQWIGKVPLVVDYKINPILTGNNELLDLSEDFSMLTENDFVKFVITKIEDFKVVEKVVEKSLASSKVTLAFSPNYAKVSPKTLIQWAIVSGFDNFVLNTQLHKLVKMK